MPLDNAKKLLFEIYDIFLDSLGFFLYDLKLFYYFSRFI
jgi:hypothetical protein